ncbi:MAG: glycoside hydrolase family 5 protein [Thermoproteota archaeon]|nr:glycoside hydrolase family 5 protein [Thermoproteota archaeon]
MAAKAKLEKLRGCTLFNKAAKLPRSLRAIAIEIVLLIVVVSTVGQSLGQNVQVGCTTLPVTQYRAVNLIDKRLVAIEARDWLNFTTPSMYDRLNEIESTGFNAIRVPLFWEAYIVNPTTFVSTLQEISTNADQLNMCVVYDFHQDHTGSHFNYWGGGFPSFLTGSYSADRNGELAFWTDYYDNNISYNGTQIWDLQFNFIRDVVIKHVDNHPSTAGYEILNEPPVNDCNQFAKLGDVHTYIGNKMRSVTLKPIYFDRAQNESCPYWDYEPYDILVVPRGVSNIVFAPHIYITGSPTPALTYLISLSQKWHPGMPIFIGEWGQSPPNDEVSQNVVNNYLQAFKSNNVGWAYWSWDPVFPFAVKDQSYQDTIYKAYLQSGIKSSYGS